MEIYIGYLLKGVVLPPALNFFAILFALVAPRLSQGKRRVIIGVSIVSLWLWSTPFIAAWHAHSLEDYDAFSVHDETTAEAIVVLSASHNTDAPEYDGRDTVGSDTLERMRYGAYLARRLALPVAVTGGAVFEPDTAALGDLMAQILREEYNIAVQWVEAQSRNTAENAANLRALLPYERIILVTHALHMPRAKAVFAAKGFSVDPAPMGYQSGPSVTYGLFDCLPSAGALSLSRAVLHEWLGIAYYRLRHHASS